jgi:hypothetical protein
MVRLSLAVFDFGFGDTDGEGPELARTGPAGGSIYGGEGLRSRMDRREGNAPDRRSTLVRKGLFE